MIIECIKCYKKFEVNSDLIPDKGRSIQCGSCNHTWFFDKSNQLFTKIIKKKSQIKSSQAKQENNSNKINIKNNIESALLSDYDKINKRKSSEIIKYQHKRNFTFSRFLSYILVFIISMIALVIVLDTFKSSLYVFFPNLELLLNNLYETLKDINLFIKDLI